MMIILITAISVASLHLRMPQVSLSRWHKSNGAGVKFFTVFGCLCIAAAVRGCQQQHACISQPMADNYA